MTGGDQQEVFSMPTNKWDVEDALNEVVRAIQDGSALSIRGLEDGYKQRYYEDFYGHWYADDYSWPDASSQILQLAKVVGHLATALTIYKAHGKGEVAVAVDASSAYMAGYLVAKGLCPPGVWCMKYYYMERNRDPQEAIEYFQEFLGKLAEIEESP